MFETAGAVLQAAEVVGVVTSLPAVEGLWADVEVTLSLPIELVRAHPKVRENTGCVAMQRGSIVYCLEQIDNLVPPHSIIPPEDRSLANRIPFHRIVLPQDAKLTESFEPDLLDGVVVIHGDAVYDSD